MLSHQDPSDDSTLPCLSERGLVTTQGQGKWVGGQRKLVPLVSQVVSTSEGSPSLATVRSISGGNSWILLPALFQHKSGMRVTMAQ